MMGAGFRVFVDGRSYYSSSESTFFKKRFPIFFFLRGAGGGIFTIKGAILINLRTDAKISLLIQSGSQKVVEDHAITDKITPIKQCHVNF